MEFIKKITDKIERFKERRKYGFELNELWSLDYTIIKFVIPRLKVFRERTIGFPADFYYANPDEPTQEELNIIHTGGCPIPTEEASARWMAVLDHMIWSMEEWIKEDGFFWDSKLGEIDKEKEKKVQEGFDLFHKYFFALWD